MNPHSPDNALSCGAACAIQIWRSASYPGSSEAAVPEMIAAIRHYTFYEFADVEEARELTDCDKIKPLIADLDRVWGNRVSRRREILEIVQEIVS